MKSALFITAYLLPTATLGTVSGVLVDRLPKNVVLTAVNAARLGFLLILLMSDQSLWTVYGVALLIAVTSQFSSPAEASALPRIVRADQLTSANSVSSLGGLVSQLVGFAVLPPLFLNTIGAKPLFLVAAALFAGGAGFFLGIGRLGAREIDPESAIDAAREVRKQFAQAWETLGRDLASYMSVIIFVLASTASLVAVTLMARFTQEALGVPVRNAVFVFLPAAVGVLAGLRLVPWLERWVAKSWLVGVGFGLLVASFACLAFSGAFADRLERLNLLGLFDPGPFGDTSARIMVTIVFSIVAAFSFAVVGVASRSLINERVPLEIQGRVFAAQTVLTNLASIAPILLAGLLSELLGVEPVLLLAAGILLGVAVWAMARAMARPVRRSDAETG